ncbi:hypothetical protein SISSUDRAFT_529643 [Sistotremastrum suecicum HHB10207 ss-3]|uniref:Uncharacterized protein n=1 Tax=Sistotremastrum suecicum HHB10207 ss-3 TaxID=1314776 RepID=A0A165XTP7_9AGAM|nr:hypothetical protein SISSUDRAFT_529643 [Sistotremastrum suecicum HHB10207 ss-3]
MMSASLWQLSAEFQPGLRLLSPATSRASRRTQVTDDREAIGQNLRNLLSPLFLSDPWYERPDNLDGNKKFIMRDAYDFPYGHRAVDFDAAVASVTVTGVYQVAYNNECSTVGRAAFDRQKSAQKVASSGSSSNPESLARVACDTLKIRLRLEDWKETLLAVRWYCNCRGDRLRLMDIALFSLLIATGVKVPFHRPTRLLDPEASSYYEIIIRVA